MEDSAPLLSDHAQPAASRPKNRTWVRLAVVSTAGLLGPLLVFVLGDRLRHCPPVSKPVPLANDVNLTMPTALPQHSQFADPAWQLNTATRLSNMWGLERLQFIHIAAMTFARPDRASDLLRLGSYKQYIVVAIIEGAAPKRRKLAQPYLSSAAGDDAPVAAILPLAAINRAALGFEKALGRRLFPLRLEVADLPGKEHPLSPPFATFNVSSGVITLEAAMFRQMGNMTHLSEGVSDFAGALFSQMSRFPSLKVTSDVRQVAEVVLSAAASAVGVAIAYQVPLWFCIACPVVLGMLAPFVINGGLGLLASEACSHWQLPAQDCNDLWYGVFAAGMVLSLASAIPIVFLCKLPQCAHRNKGFQ